MAAKEEGITEVPCVFIEHLTEAPNEQAANLRYDELFDISKNSFSQFFGRTLLGKESDYRQYFNVNNFFWMHVKGSTCHGDKKNDGKKAIRERINFKDYCYIVTFGLPATKIFLSNFEAKLSFISEIMSNGPVPLKAIQGAHINLFNDECATARVVMLPHVSGQGQHYWMRYAEVFSHCLNLMQREIIQIIRDDFTILG